MKNTLAFNKHSFSIITLGFLGFILPVHADMNDDPVLTKVMLDKFELGKVDGESEHPLAWEAEAWIGKDIHKLKFKTEGERVGGVTAGMENQLLLSKAITPYWNLQGGWRRDKASNEHRDYATIGIEGLAPFYFETDASISFAKDDHIKLNVSAEYEMMLTQKWVLIPEIELNAYSKDDLMMGVASGFSDIEAGLRLGYEIRREFAPYIGIIWEKKLGGTADLARDEGEDTSETKIVAGVRVWF